jgi:hypothetical protein
MVGERMLPRPRAVENTAKDTATITVPYCVCLQIQIGIASSPDSLRLVPSLVTSPLVRHLDLRSLFNPWFESSDLNSNGLIASLSERSYEMTHIDRLLDC